MTNAPFAVGDKVQFNDRTGDPSNYGPYKIGQVVTVARIEFDPEAGGDFIVDLVEGDIPTQRQGWGVSWFEAAPSTEPRTYVVGIPLAMVLHPDGRVDFHFDLGEVEDAEPGCEDETSELQVSRDLLTLSEVAARLGNCFTTTINPTR